jgi:hypothetical protein
MDIHGGPPGGLWGESRGSGRPELAVVKHVFACSEVMSVSSGEFREDGMRE